MPASIKHLTDKKLNLTSLLARWKDGLYYTAAIVKCDKINKRCLVCFEDGSEVWVNNRDVHLQLSLDQLSEDEDIVCCICDDGKSEPPNEIILCDVCQQGYHQKCHNPPVDSSTIDESDDTNDHKDWFCVTCSYILHQSNREKLSADAQQPKQKQTQQQPSASSTSKTSPQKQSQQQQQPKQHKPSPQQPQTPTQTPSLQQQQQQQSPQQKPKPKPQQQPQPQTTAPQVPNQIQAQPQQVAPHQEQAERQQATVNKTPVKPSPQAPSNQGISQTSTVGPIKPTSANHAQKQAAAAPYYPLSNQVRAVATSSTAALASMTASSALVVGSSAGRTKQDLVNQSNRSTQQRQQQQQQQQQQHQQQQRQPGSNVEVVVQQTPVKHAVRKSSVNFVMPVRQSALPTATRSVPPSMPATGAARSPSFLSVPSSSHSPTAANPYPSSVSFHQHQAATSIVRNSVNNKSMTEMRNKFPSSFSQVTSVVSTNNNNTNSTHNNDIKTSASSMEACITSSTSSPSSALHAPRMDTTSVSLSSSTSVATPKSGSGECVKGPSSFVTTHHQGLTMFANNGSAKIIPRAVAESKNTSIANSSAQNEVSNSGISNNSKGVIAGSVVNSTVPATISSGNVQPTVTVNSADSSTKIGQNST